MTDFEIVPDEDRPAVERGAKHWAAAHAALLAGQTIFVPTPNGKSVGNTFGAWARGHGRQCATRIRWRAGVPGVYLWLR